jgi:hypothetical protein
MMLGRYDDTLVLEEGGWKIQMKRNILQAAIPLPTSVSHYAGIPVDPNG